ncbi:MAG TPA: division/cell wall cluster transcriptional repressor MraZ [Candidatus Paceibacterota bacterium]|jgi:MraZ protein|nr:division/cell wall cluster transcriptional repressor MraZ [Candidatus Paceibacterota bacterium]
MYDKWEKVGKARERVSTTFMLIGEYIHTIDAKNRISLPAKFRKELGKKVIVTPGLDQCLFLFTEKDWAKVSKRLSDPDAELSFLSADKRSFNRYMFGRAAEAEVDSIGRILIPDFLKDRIGLKGSAAVVGVEDRVEIWNEKAWTEYKAVVEKEAGQLAEKLSQGRQGK